MFELRWNPLLGEWLATAIKRQDRTFLPPADLCPLCPTKPDMMVMHQCSLDGGSPYDHYHYHIEFYPPLRSANRLKYLAGMFINDTLPEEKAAEIRAHVGAVVWAGEKTGQ